jgi:hypothetical protein
MLRKSNSAASLNVRNTVNIYRDRGCSPQLFVRVSENFFAAVHYSQATRIF